MTTVKKIKLLNDLKRCITLKIASACDSSCDECDVFNSMSELLEMCDSVAKDLAHYEDIRSVIDDYNTDYCGNYSKEEYFDAILATF